MTTAPLDEPFETVMSDADSLMWTIERDPILRSTVTAVSLLDRPPDWSRALRRLDAATARIPRLRQRVRTFPFDAARPEWEATDLDLGYHFRRIALPAPGPLDDALEVARTMAIGAFDPTRPLWEFVVVENLEGGRAALIQKFHHTVTDGIGGVRLALELLDDHPESTVVTSAPDETAVASPRWFIDAIAVQRANRAKDVVLATPHLAGRATRALVHGPVGALARAADTARSVAHTLAPVTEPMSPILRGRSQSWALRCFDVDLHALKAAAKHADATVNDVFVASISIAMERYHRAFGAAPTMLRLTMPMSIRRPGDPPGGNRFTPLRFAIPVTGPAGDDRVRTIRDVLRRERSEPAVALTPVLAAALDALPAAVVTPLFGGMLKNIDFVATNVPGVPFRCWFAGAEVLRQYAFAPPSGAALNISLLSHGDVACIGIVADTAAVSDVDLIATELADALAGFAERRVRRARRVS